jgi:hypothetical protein
MSGRGVGEAPTPVWRCMAKGRLWLLLGPAGLQPRKKALRPQPPERQRHGSGAFHAIPQCEVLAQRPRWFGLPSGFPLIYSDATGRTAASLRASADVENTTQTVVARAKLAVICLSSRAGCPLTGCFALRQLFQNGTWVIHPTQRLQSRSRRGTLFVGRDRLLLLFKGKGSIVLLSILTFHTTLSFRK